MYRELKSARAVNGLLLVASAVLLGGCSGMEKSSSFSQSSLSQATSQAIHGNGVTSFDIPVKAPSVKSVLSSNKKEDQSGELVNDGRLEQSFIGIKMKRLKGSTFYEVRTDSNENVYLPLESFLKKWLELSPKCDSEALTCQVFIPEQKKTYYIDGKNNFAKVDGSKVEIIDNSIILQDNKLWISHNAMAKWLPLRTIWSLKYYELDVTPEFLLPKESKAKWLRSREHYMKRAEQKENFDKMDSIKPDEDDYSFEWRASARSNYLTRNGDFTDPTVSADIGGDFKRAHWQMGFNEKEINYWYAERFDNLYFEHMRVGDVRFNGDLLIQGVNARNGISADKIYNEVGSGTLDKRIQTEPFSDAELIVNGYWIKSLKADKSGYIDIKGLMVSNSDQVIIRILTPNGLTQERVIHVAGSPGDLLDKGEWDHRTVVGEKGYTGDFMFVHEQKYGLLDKVSMSAKFFSLPTETDREDFVTLGVNWRILPDLNLRYQSDTNNEFSSVQVQYTGIDDHFLSYTMREIDDKSFLNRHDNYYKTGGQDNYQKLFHSFGFDNAVLENTLEFGNEFDKYEGTIRYRLSQDNTLTGFYDRKKYDRSGNVSQKYGANIKHYLSNSSSAEAEVGKINNNTYWNSKLTWVGNSSAPWTEKMINNSPYVIDASLSGRDLKHINWNLGMSWKFNEYLSGTLSVNRNSAMMGLRATFGGKKVSGKAYKNQPYFEFGKGDVEGYIKTPPAGKEGGKPIQNVKVYIGNQESVTDKNGYFVIKNVPANSRYQLIVDEDDLDVNLLPEEKAWPIELRPATKINFNPGLIWVTGLDGMVADVNEEDTINMNVVFIHKEKGEIANAAVESDGFFIVEKLYPGNYTVEVRNGDKVIRSSKANIKPNSDWVYEFRI